MTEEVEGGVRRHRLAGVAARILNKWRMEMGKGREGRENLQS